MPNVPKKLEAESSLYSAGKLADLTGRKVGHIMGAASVLDLRPMSIDLVPFWNGDQAEKILEWLDTHQFTEGEGPEIEDVDLGQADPTELKS